MTVEKNILYGVNKEQSKDHSEMIQSLIESLGIHHHWKIPILLVTHNLEEAQKLGDRIPFMEKGKFVNKIADVG